MPLGEEEKPFSMNESIFHCTRTQYHKYRRSVIKIKYRHRITTKLLAVVNTSSFGDLGDFL